MRASLWLVACLFLCAPVRAQTLRSLPSDPPPPLPNPSVYDAAVEYGSGRQLQVRRSEERELRPSPPKWQSFHPFQPTPPTPPQTERLLTASDPLTIAVPLFQYRPWFAEFEVRFTREGNTLFLDAYTLLNLGISHTISGPQEYLAPIGTLPAGEYTLHVRNFQGTDGSLTRDFDAFRTDPAAYARDHDVQVSITRQTLPFVVAVPEPAALLPATGTLLLLRRTRRRPR